MSKPILFLIVAVILIILGIVIHRSFDDNLNVTPDAAKEIEKAKGR
ncbi:MAG: hypothetical protein ABJF23_18565 [Bryobacteraceae bacterium]